MKNALRFWIRRPKLDKLSIGQAGEEWVAYLYRRDGYRVLHRNFEIYSTKKLGELDLLCVRGKELVAVEVKTRKNEEFMRVEEAVDWRKQSLLRRMIKFFLHQHPEYEDCEVRIDVAVVLMNPFDNSINSVRIITNAVEDDC